MRRAARHLFGRRGAIPVLVAAFAAIVAAVASAYLTTDGTAGGTATNAALQSVTVSALAGGDSPSSALLPGGSADVVLRVSNPNSYAVTLVSVSGGPGPVTADSGHPGCTNPGVAFTDQTGLSTPIPASASTLVDLPAAASMSTASSDGCQGATFSIPVTITVRRG